MAAMCDTVTPREAPPPCDPQTDPTGVPPASFREPLTPETVRDNIRDAITTPTLEPNYRVSLTDEDPGAGIAGFAYLPDESARSAATQGFFDGWNKEREVQFMLAFREETVTPLDSFETVEMNFPVFQDTGELQGTDQARYEVQYELIREFSDRTVEPPVVINRERYTGRAFWDLIGGDSNFWTLQKWEDLEPLTDDEDPAVGTLGILRAVLGAQG
ncbi:MAG: hypothetical protein ACE5G2_05150 [Candidatus Krumholzibacteriia bacterium]